MNNKLLDVFLFIALFVIFYFTSFKLNVDIAMFLTISTFLFAIFTGFFISRQGSRYSQIRDTISRFDGEISSIYRQLGHIDKKAQREFINIAEDYYDNIIKHKSWDYNFLHKTSTITDIHILVEDYTKDQNFTSLKSLALERILSALRELQSIRKKMISLHTERIPSEQWRLIYFLAAILLVTIFSIVSHNDILASLLKVAFSGSIIMILYLLRELDKLHFFEGIIGENSAQDVLDIMHNKK